MTKVKFSKSQLTKALPLLKLICESGEKERDSIINHMSDSTAQIVCGCAYNALHHRGIARRNEIYDTFKNKSNDLRYVSNFNKPIRLRKKRLIKHGKGVGIIIASVLPLIANFIASHLSKKKKK